jgi:hypothetical protein
VSANEDEGLRSPRFGRFGEVDDFRHVGKIVARECDHLRAPVVDRGEVVLVLVELEIEQPYLMTRAARRFGDQLEAKRLQAKENLGVHQGARVDR